MLHALRLALRFLTRLPVPGSHDVAPGDLARSLAWYPAVGALVGGLLALLGLLLVRAELPVAVSALVLTLAGPLLTGGLHEDGLADTADGLGGHASRERALEIMRDSRIGTYGGIALFGALAMRWSLLTALPTAAWPVALVVAHAVARLPPVLLIRALPYARAEGLAGAMISDIATWHVGMAVVLATAVALGAGGVAGGMALGAALLLSLVCGRWFRRRVGGVTGDLAGATVLLTELLVLLMFVQLA